ncbi:MAG TPA: Ig-like domain-containing protein [Saprospiraceae bacterium]|nr:Ig-like domain-containing protein [Saprospiraceae bacterium]
MRNKLDLQVAKQNGLWTEIRSLSGFMRTCKFLFAGFLVFALHASIKAQPTTLSVGDLAFSGYKANDAVADQFSFVLLKNINATTVIRFTDYGWRTDEGAFTNHGNVESEIIFTANSNLVAGQEIMIVGSTVTIVNPATGSGSVVYTTGPNFLVGNISLTNSGDQIFAYQGTFAAPTFIAGIHCNVYIFANGDFTTTTAAAWDGVIPILNQNSNSSSKPAPFTTGTNANWITPENDNVRFICGSTPVNTVPAALAALNSGHTTPANWLANSTNPSGFTLPTGCMYLVGGGCSITLSSGAGSNVQTRCVNTAITPITYSIAGSTGANFSGLPTGVTGAWTASTITISGTPSVTGTFNYTVTLTGGSCTTENATGTITVNPNNTILLISGPGSNTQTVNAFTPITNIVFSTTSATGATFSGLPAGVTGNWSSNVVTISGSPTATGIFNYLVTLTGGCGMITAGGTITVNPGVCSITLTSAPGTTSQTVLINTSITPITYSTTVATGATFTGLPTGVTGNWASNVVTISGTPSVAGVFNYKVTLTGGSCTTENAMGTITVNGLPAVLVPGDIAFSGYKATDDPVPDQFSFVLLKNIAINSVIKFTDYGWRTDEGAFTNHGNVESEIIFTANTNLVAGQEITIVGSTVTIVNPATGSGSVVYTTGPNFLAGNISFPNTGDQLFAYQGTFAAPTFIAGLHMNVYTAANGDPTITTAAAWDGVIPVANQNSNSSGKPAALTTGTNANWFTTEWENIRFICGSTPITTVPLTLAALNSGNTIPGNWITDENPPAGFTLPTLCPYLAPPPPCSVTLTSAPGTNAQMACLNAPITNITYSNTAGQGASGANFAGLPAGVTCSWAANVSTITGSPTTLTGSPFSYTVTILGGTCAGLTANGTITVGPSQSANFSYALNGYCKTGTDPLPIIYGNTGGTFSAPAQVVINSTSGLIDVSASTAGGPFTITYMNVGTCPGTATFPVSIVNCLPDATMTDAISIDNGTPGSADPNDRIKMTTAIINNQVADYEGMQLVTSNDPKVIFVAGSFKSTPVAVNDLYATTLNMMLTVPVGTGVLANDFDNNIPGLTVTTFPTVSTQGGTISGNANGSFTYTPLNGYTGNDSFNYTITDSDAQTNLGTVKIHVQ